MPAACREHGRRRRRRRVDPRRGGCGSGECDCPLRGRNDFPGDVAASLAALGVRDADAYETAVRSVLRSFETRDAYLEGVPVADTVLVLQALAAERGVDAALDSPLLPGL